MRSLGIGLLGLLFLIGEPVVSAAGAETSRGAKASKSGKAKPKASKAQRAARLRAEAAARARAKRRGKLARGKRGKRGRRNYFSGHGVPATALRATPVPKPSGKLWLYTENLHEEVRVAIYHPDGSFDEDALAALDRGFRCKRTGETRAVDPRLYETLSVISDHFGGRRIDLVSGFRFQRNEGSRHYHASAADIRIDGVSQREIYEFAESLDVGGMGIGIYPRSGFVHVDYRAPGDASYRWVDRSPPDGDSPNKRPSARFKPRS